MTAALLHTMPLTALAVDILPTNPGLRWAGRVNVVGTDVQFDYPGVGVTFTVVGTANVDMLVCAPVPWLRAKGVPLQTLACTELYTEWCWDGC